MTFHPPPMRVLIASDSFPPKIDGVSDTAAVLCRALTARGHHVIAIAPGDGPPSEYGAHVLRLKSLPLPFYPEVRLAWQLRTVRRLVRRLDVHAAIVLTLGPVGLSVARWLPPRTRLVHVYTTDMPSYLRAYRAPFLVPVANALTRRVGVRAAATLCPTPFVLDALERTGVPRLQVWGRGVDAELFHPGRRSAATRARLTGGEPERPIVLYAGRLAAEKRLLDLLEAARRLPDARFVFVGDGPQRTQLERLFPPGRTVFTGFLRGAPLAEAIAAADVFAFPSDSDTFAQVVLQAMASAVPPVVIEHSAPANIVRDGVSGLHVRARAPHELAAAIERLVRDPALGHRLGSQAHQQAADYSWETLADEMERLLFAEL